MHVCITTYFRHAGYSVIWQMYNAFYTNQVPNWRCRKRDPDLDSIVPADATAHSNVMPSVGTVTNHKRFFCQSLLGYWSFQIDFRGIDSTAWISLAVSLTNCPNQIIKVSCRHLLSIWLHPTLHIIPFQIGWKVRFVQFFLLHIVSNGLLRNMAHVRIPWLETLLWENFVISYWDGQWKSFVRWNLDVQNWIVQRILYLVTDSHN